MEKKPGRVIFRVTLIIYSLLLLALLYADFYGSNVVLFYQRAQPVSRWQLSSVKDAQPGEAQESNSLGIRSREADEEILQEDDSGQKRYNISKLNEAIEVQKPRLHSPGSTVVDETTLQEHESRPLSQKSRVFNETIEVQDSRPESPGSRAEETPHEHESRQVSRSNGEFNETIEALEPRPEGLRSRETEENLQEHESGQVNRSNRDINETTEVKVPTTKSLGSREIEETLQEQESRQVHQSSRESNETGRVESKSSQLTNSSRELNETAVERRAEQPSSSNWGVNGTVEPQKSEKLIREVHETIGGQDSRQLDPIDREVNERIKEHDSRDSLFTRLVRGEDRTKLEATGFACHTAPQSVVCVTNQPVTIDMATMKVHIRADQNVEPNHTVVRPYARQDDADVLRNIRPVHFFHGNTRPPACQYKHDVPAVIFSSSGFTGNLFHEFNEIIIPLFITTYHFRSRVQFILMDYKPTFANKYKKVMSRLSSYEVIDPAANPSVHCFSGAVAGLKWHDHLALNSSDIPGGYTMPTFRQFLRQAYNLKIISVSEIKRPKLMLLSRRGTRKFLNEAEMVRMMKDLGFEVIVATKPNRMSNLNKFARVVNSCTVLVGSHGAGLANELFLPDGAVMVQVDPLGLEWGSAYFYGNPAEAMRVHYLRYKIEPEESSLLDIYGRNHPVITDPASIFAKGYQAGRAVFLDQQNMKVNTVRFRETLLEALRLTGFSTPQKQ